MKDPAFLFYSQDFLVGTLTMSFEDKGKYITILSYMHQQGRLDEKTISLLVGSISDNLKSKFSIDEKGFYYNSRLELEIEKRIKFTESRRNNGVKGGRPKKETETYKKPLGYASANLVEDVNEDDKLKEVFNKYCEHIKNVSVYQRLAMNKGIKPTEIVHCINEFIDTCYASIMEKKNKFEVEEYFLNWVKKDGRVLECVNNQHRKNGKKQ